MEMKKSSWISRLTCNGSKRSVACRVHPGYGHSLTQAVNGISETSNKF